MFAGSGDLRFGSPNCSPRARPKVSCVRRDRRPSLNSGEVGRPRHSACGFLLDRRCVSAVECRGSGDHRRCRSSSVRTVSIRAACPKGPSAKRRPARVAASGSPFTAGSSRVRCRSPYALPGSVFIAATCTRRRSSKLAPRPSGRRSLSSGFCNGSARAWSCLSSSSLRIRRSSGCGCLPGPCASCRWASSENLFERAPIARCDFFNDRTRGEGAAGGAGGQQPI